MDLLKKSINKRIFLNGAIIFIKNYKMTEPMILDIKQDLPFVKLHFELQGKSHYEPENEQGVPITIEDGQYNFFYLPSVWGKLSLKSKIRKSIEFDCEEWFLKKLFKNNFYSISGSFGKAMKNRTPYKMWNNGKEIPQVLNYLLNDIITISEQENIDLVSLESKIIGIFRYLFSEINQTNKDIELSDKLEKIERDRITSVEKILRKNLDRSFTAEELAIEIGTNRYKLYRNFKQVYNQPIFTYLTRLRMEKAKLMLVQDGLKVSEVSEKVGYKNPQHFTVAFKKYFGLVPSKLKCLMVES